MILLAQPAPAGLTVPRIGPVHRFALAFVWVTFAASAIVFTEPAPVDMLMLIAVAMLPMLGLVRITPPLLLFLAIWLTAAACALIGTINAHDIPKAVTHTAITFFLTVSSFVTAAFIMRRPERHTQLIMHAYVIAAVVAGGLAMIGYFNVLPGAYDLFTRYGRASGTFKDPNVFGPFLVAPTVYLLHRILTRSLPRAIATVAWCCLLVLAVLLSFSRGAWINLTVATGIFGLLTFLTAQTNLQRIKITGGALLAACIALVVLVGTLQVESIADQFAGRATMDQTYDEGAEGRFGGQEKARRLILEHPLGIGALQFAPYYHVEEPHNVYLAMFLNAGWLGGMIFALMVLTTCVYGLRHAFRRTRTQGLFIIAYACFVAHALEGFVIDLDHWRHFHVLMALVWGLMLGDRQYALPPQQADPRAITDPPAMAVARRPARLMVPIETALVRRPKNSRRALGREDSRPSRSAGRTFARDVP